MNFWFRRLSPRRIENSIKRKSMETFFWIWFEHCVLSKPSKQLTSQSNNSIVLQWAVKLNKSVSICQKFVYFNWVDSIESIKFYFVDCWSDSLSLRKNEEVFIIIGSYSGVFGCWRLILSEKFVFGKKRSFIWRSKRLETK